MKITRLQSKSQQGQALIIFVLVIIGLLALVGIVTDVALIYVHYDHLRRAVDAAAVSAVNQYREGRQAQDLYESIVQTLQLQLAGVQNVRFYWCNPGGDNNVEYEPGLCYDSQDDTLCSDPPRKRVRVEAELPVGLVFLSLVWGDQVVLYNSAEAEAAVLNMVLLLDTSESMAYDTCDPNLPEPDFFHCLDNCRAAGTCRPFDGTPSVRWAAYNFVDTLMRDGVDRVAVYHFDKTPVISQSVEMLPCSDPPTLTIPITLTPSSGMIVPLTTTKSLVLSRIQNGQGNYNDPLNVYIRPPACDPSTHECCNTPTHVGGWYGEEGDGYGYRWASTNIGGGLREAIGELVNNGTTDAAVWVIVLLSDGAANATDWAADVNQWWTCPSPSGLGPNYRTLANPGIPFCRDPESDGIPTRHCPSQEVCDRGDPWYTNPGHVYDEWVYDADDYARDIADLASSQQIAIYTIGFGPKVLNAPRGRADAGERLLRYIADVGDDGDLETAPCASDYYWDDVVVDMPDPGENCGNYYYAPDAASLEDVFESIASRIFSRITQ